MTRDIFHEFKLLPFSETESDFSAISLSSKRGDFLAKNEHGAPVFLLHDSGPTKYYPSIFFRHLTAQFQVTCAVTSGGKIQTGQFCLVSCDPVSSDLYELFVRCVNAAIQELPVESSTPDIELCLSKLRNLFRAFSSPNSREISGLWSELFLISISGDVERALGIWHSDQFDRFDFSDQSRRLEVKSSTRGIRIHDFSLEQLSPPHTGNGIVASLLLQPLSGGVGILDLARDIEKHVDHSPRLKKKIWENLATTLGSDFSEKLDKRFDLKYSEKSLILYDMRDVPAPPESSDPRVTGIRFLSNLANVTPSFGTDSRRILRNFFC